MPYLIMLPSNHTAFLRNGRLQPSLICGVKSELFASHTAILDSWGSSKVRSMWHNLLRIHDLWQAQHRRALI